MKSLQRSLKQVVLTASLTSLLTSCYRPLSETVTDTSAGINGSFEQIKNNLPVNWLCYTNKTISDSDFDLLIDTINYKEGKRSLKFGVRKCSNLGGNASPGIAQELTLATDKEYIISCWVKNNTSTFSINITGVDELHSSEGPKYISSESNKEWKKLEFKYKLPKEMKRLRIEISVLSPGTFWIDELTIGNN